MQREPVRVLRKRSKSNHPALSPSLLGEFLRKLDAVEAINEQTRIAMQPVVLTACHKAEVIGASWSEFNLKAAEWEVPAERMKAGRAHWVPLSSQVLRLLSALRAIVRRRRCDEHCLAHVPGDRVRAAYNRHAYQDECRKMLQSWANHVAKLKRADSGGGQARLTAEARLARSASSAR